MPLNLTVVDCNIKNKTEDTELIDIVVDNLTPEVLITETILIN